ncbi:glycerol dehydratase reactivation factor [halophilic archaeon]|nr:glycerol dehydratase reactivation factor [halophilic archaeon]
MSQNHRSIDEDDTMPYISVRCIGDRELELVEYIEYGIEEEGVSWMVDSELSGDSVSIAYEASVNSPLKIGVSVTAESRIVVHHQQLPDDNPLFNISDVTPKLARKLGANSARLAKGTPLKTVD